jgi:hypothetical protein
MFQNQDFLVWILKNFNEFMAHIFKIWTYYDFLKFERTLHFWSKRKRRWMKKMIIKSFLVKILYVAALRILLVHDIMVKNNESWQPWTIYYVRSLFSVVLLWWSCFFLATEAIYQFMLWHVCIYFLDLGIGFHFVLWLVEEAPTCVVVVCFF